MSADQSAVDLGLPITERKRAYAQPDPSGAKFGSHTRVGDLLFCSGTVATRDGQAYLPGVVAADRTIMDGQRAARLACVGALQVWVRVRLARPRRAVCR